MLVSVVIPVQDDSEALAALLAALPPAPDAEVVVSLAGGTDGLLARTQAERQDVHWVSGPPGRGPQLNRGAALATGRWLWFLHADSQPPHGWQEEFARLDVEEVVGGSFEFALASAAWQARVLEWFVRRRVALFGLPYGDQGLFVRREVFNAMGGFAPLPLMEDVEFVRRLNRRGPVAHLTRQLRTSARRWEREGWWRRSAHNLATLSLYALGISPVRLVARYDRKITTGRTSRG